MSPSPWLPFQWSHQGPDGQYLQRAALFVPGALPTAGGLSGWFQFDLGAPTTVLYGQAFTPEQRERLQAQPQRPRPAIFNGQEVPVLEMPVRFGPWEVSPVIWLADFGDDEPMPDGRPVLGTVGSDFAREHVLAVDFPGERLTRMDTVPTNWEAAAHWTPMRLTEHGHVLIQVEVDEEPHWVMFDTGSSIFEFITSDALWHTLCHGQVTKTLRITAWGEALDVLGGPVRAQFTLAGQPLPVRTAYYYRNMPGWDAFQERFGFLGLMGNAPFWERVIVLDFPHGRFGILPPGFTGS